MSRPGPLTRALGRRIGRGVDERFQLAGLVRSESSHVFPKHHSFLWGELALYSFVVLLVTGTYLSLFFVPDTTEVVYQGAYDNLRGLHVSRAYESALNLSFEVRGGLFVRQIHHWAAHVFVASIVVHMCRNFFTGAFRKPRELTWLTGIALLALSMLEGYLGYSMLDDLLSGVGVRIASGLVLSIPVVGTWLHWLVFGGEFEGELWISRFFVGHVFVLPGLLCALVGVHLLLVWYQKHTHFPGPGATGSTVVGDRAAPGFLVRTAANGLAVVAVLALLGALFQINPVFLWGPTRRSTAPRGCSRTGTSASSSGRCGSSRRGTCTSARTP
ncbi:cytochrome b [Saccharopolyspora sp. CA-218241]|uniref:cytochrome b n=1 Tax=Saccharopolyspora sp. CA-218241 TaxID=3240027 RepID=UPI003D9A0851